MSNEALKKVKVINIGADSQLSKSYTSILNDTSFFNNIFKKYDDQEFDIEVDNYFFNYSQTDNKVKILGILDAEAEKLKSDNNTTCFILIFSGHGRGIDEIDENSHQRIIELWFSVGTAGNNDNDCIYDKEIRDFFSKIPCFKVLILNCCYGENFFEGETTQTFQGDKNKSTKSKSPFSNFPRLILNFLFDPNKIDDSKIKLPKGVNNIISSFNKFKNSDAYLLLKTSLNIDNNKKDYLLKSIVPEFNMDIIEMDNNFEQPLLVIAAASVEMFETQDLQFSSFTNFIYALSKLKFDLTLNTFYLMYNHLYNTNVNLNSKYDEYKDSFLNYAIFVNKAYPQKEELQKQILKYKFKKPESIF